jgi:DNA-binding transcriptional LysR family regulator
MLLADMGLDLVELALAVEETFDIALPDAEAEKLVTPALLIEAIVNKVRTAEHSVCLSRTAFHALRRTLVASVGCGRAAVKPDTALESLIPRAGRRSAWRQMREALRANRWPVLQRPGWVRLSLFLIFAVVAGGLGFAGFPVWAALGSGVGLWSLALVASQPLCIELPKSCRTAGQLAQFLVAHAPKLFEPTGRVWTRAEVAETVRCLTIEHLGLKPEQYREGARFVQDLGGG